jgi:hypothetical protein
LYPTHDSRGFFSREIFDLEIVPISSPRDLSPADDTSLARASRGWTGGLWSSETWLEIRFEALGPDLSTHEPKDDPSRACASRGRTGGYRLNETRFESGAEALGPDLSTHDLHPIRTAN